MENNRLDIYPHNTQTLIAKIIHIASAIIYITCGIIAMAISRVENFEKAAVIMISIATIIIGAASILGYFSNDMYRLAFQSDFALGIFDIILGVLMLIQPENSIKILSLFAGIMTLLDGGNKSQISIEGYRFGISKWYLVLITGVLEIAMAIIVLIFSFTEDANLIIAVGISIILFGFANAWTTMYTVRIKNNRKQIKEQKKIGRENGKD